MTLDDLHSIFKAARQGTREWNGTEWVGEWHGDRAGVTAIVRALRDEFYYNMQPHTVFFTAGKVALMFNEILGSDAGADLYFEHIRNHYGPPAPQANTVELSQAFVSQIEQSRTEAHRNAAPAVCEWAYAHLGLYARACGCTLEPRSKAGDFCPSCGKPIAFTEANHG